MTEDVSDATILEWIDRIRAGEKAEVTIPEMNRIIERIRPDQGGPPRRVFVEIGYRFATVRLAGPDEE